METTYNTKPAPVQVFPLGDKTDLILRRDIRKTTLQTEDGQAQEAWACQERQLRLPGSISAQEVAKNFDRYWSWTPPAPKPKKTQEQRLAQLEELVEALLLSALEE